MKQAKRQIILGALILALGTAVYVNWQFESQAIPSGTEGMSSQPDSSESVGDDIDDGNIGISQLVNNSYLENVTDDNEIPVTLSDPLSDARIARQEARDSAISMLEEILDDTEASDEVKQKAIEDAAKIADNMLKETSAENLIKAKGIDDVIVYMNEDMCNVIVKGLDDNTLIIQEIVCNQFNIAVDKIHIIDTN